MKTKKQTKKVEKAMIKIKNIKHVDSSCEAGRIITGLEALKENKLPKVYLKGPSFWLEKKDSMGNKRLVNNKGAVVLEKGEFYAEKDFQNRLQYIERCGNRLTTLNKKLKKLREEWAGEEVTKI